MKYLHYSFNARQNNVIQVKLSSRANVLLLDNSNYRNYQNNRKYSYYGGLVTKSPYNIRPPKSGHWHLVIDSGGYEGEITASVNII